MRNKYLGEGPRRVGPRSGKLFYLEEKKKFHKVRVLMLFPILLVFDP